MASNKKKPKINSDYSLEELFPDEAERAKLEGMPEVERESLIFDRVTELQQKLDRELLLNDSKRDNKQKAIDDIKSRRRNRYSEKPKRAADESPELGEISSEEYKRNHLKKNFNKEEDQSYSADQDEDSSVKILPDEEGQGEARKEEDFRLTELELERVRVSRILFEKYHSHKLFDSTVKNCFVRLNLGGKNLSNPNESYMVATIKEVLEVPDESYRIGDNTFTKYFIAKHGENEKRFNFSIVSNSQFDAFEFNKWQARIEKAGISLPTKGSLTQKALELEEMKNYVFSSEEILKNINERRAEKIRKREKGLNITQELEEISEKYEACQMKVKDLEDDYKRLERSLDNTNSNKNINKLRREKEEVHSKLIHYKSQFAELTEFIGILSEMELDYLNEKKEENLNDKSYKINLKNVLNQKQLDKESRYLNKKRNLEESGNLANPFKRRECAPMNRFSKPLTVDFKLSSIKMTKTNEDPHVGTPKELYDKRFNGLKEVNQIYKEFLEKMEEYEKESNFVERINESTQMLNTTKKGYFGLLKSAGIDMRKYIEGENERLVKKYNIEDKSLVQEFKFI